MLIGKAPNGALIIGTADMVPGNALVTGFTREKDGTLTPEYTGGTVMCWDGQYNVEQTGGDWLLVDENGETWKASECTFTEETAEDDSNDSK
jgi:hypothetical protein